MRILHVFDHSLPIQDGYSYRSRAILLGQAEMGLETVQVTSAKHEALQEKETIGDLLFHRTCQSGSLYSRLPILNQVAVIKTLRDRVRYLAREYRPAVIHAHSPSLTGLACLSVARSLGIPLVYEVRAFWEDAAVDHGTSKEGGVRYRLTTASETYVLRHASAVTTICEGLKNAVVDRGIAAEHVTVIANGVDLDNAGHLKADSGIRRELGLEDSHVVGFIGSFYAWEGLDLLIRAFPLILEKLPKARLLLVGGGNEDQSLRSLAADLGVQDRVIFVGRVPHDRVNDYYALMDLVCFPRHSMRLTELVTPLKPLEAMARYRVCVASDVGGHKELIRDRETGFLFRSGDKNDLARVVCELAYGHIDQEKVKLAARQFVEQERTWQASVSRYRTVYASALSRKVGLNQTQV